MKNKLFLSAFAMAIATPVMVQPVQVEGKTNAFTDVSKENWAYDIIHQMRDQNVMNGYPDGSFKPANTITRQHVAVLLARLLPLEPVREGIEFKDVPKSHLYYEDIQKLYRAGIVDGSNGYFNPSDSLTRVQMAKILHLAFDLKAEQNHPFPDVQASHWGSEHVSALYSNGITTGDNGYFKPTDKVSRLHYAVFLHRALQLQKEETPEESETPEKPKEDPTPEEQPKEENPTPTPIPTPGGGGDDSPSEPKPTFSMNMSLEEYAATIDNHDAFALEEPIIISQYTKEDFANERNRRVMIEGVNIVKNTNFKFVDVNGGVKLEEPNHVSTLPPGYFNSQLYIGGVSRFGGMQFAMDYTDPDSVELALIFMDLAYPEFNRQLDPIIRDLAHKAKVSYETEYHKLLGDREFRGHGETVNVAGYDVRFGMDSYMEYLAIDVLDNH